jgi:hypothetical protein
VGATAAKRDAMQARGFELVVYVRKPRYLLQGGVTGTKRLWRMLRVK